MEVDIADKKEINLPIRCSLPYAQKRLVSKI